MRVRLGVRQKYEWLYDPVSTASDGLTHKATAYLTSPTAAQTIHRVCKAAGSGAEMEIAIQVPAQQAERQAKFPVPMGELRHRKACIRDGLKEYRSSVGGRVVRQSHQRGQEKPGFAVLRTHCPNEDVRGSSMSTPMGSDDGEARPSLRTLTPDMG